MAFQLPSPSSDLKVPGVGGGETGGGGDVSVTVGVSLGPKDFQKSDLNRGP